jgi:putative transposase
MTNDLCTINLPRELLNAISFQDPSAMLKLQQLILNEAMLLERANYLKADDYERTPQRVSYANGFKNKTINTRLGSLDLNVPQTRDSQFYPTALERGIRSEKALNVAIAEMYIQGVSTRKVTKILEKLCNLEVSSAQVSSITKKMDEEFKNFRERALEQIIILYLDARYEKVRLDGKIIDVAVLIATGINPKGKREILGVSVALSEAEIHWRNFLNDLGQRGMHGVKLIVSDDHAGLKSARKTIFPSIPWQRCLFHFCQNAQSYVPKLEMRGSIAMDLRDIFNCSNKEEADIKLKKIIEKYSKSASKFSEWLECSTHETMTFYNFNRSLWKKIRSTNYLERENREIKRRTRVVGIFPNTDSVLRLVSAILIERHEQWVSEKAYIRKEDIENL